MRWRRGRHSAEGFYRDSHDLDLLTALLLDPLSADPARPFRIAAFDEPSDSRVAAPLQEPEPDSVLLFDGLFLCRPELLGYWNYVIWVDGEQRVADERVSLATAECGPGLMAFWHLARWWTVLQRYVDGMRLYIAECRPRAHADAVIDNNDVLHPILALRADAEIGNVEYPDLHPVTLAGTRIILREIEPTGDVEASYGWASDDEFFRYLPFETVQSRDEEEAFLRGVQRDAQARPRSQYHLGITWATTGELIGMARLGIASPRHREGDIGYGLRRDRWGEGIATEATLLLLDLGFGPLGLHRIFAFHHPENIASGRVLQKVGMRQEGILRQNLFAHGTWRDSVLYSILDHEWRTAKE